jgi:hypothetical protein
MSNDANAGCTMSKVVKGVVVAVAIAGVIRLLPDFVRYMKIRSM